MELVPTTTYPSDFSSWTTSAAAKQPGWTFPPDPSGWIRYRIRFKRGLWSRLESRNDRRRHGRTTAGPDVVNHRLDVICSKIINGVRKIVSQRRHPVQLLDGPVQIATLQAAPSTPNLLSVARQCGHRHVELGLGLLFGHGANTGELDIRGCPESSSVGEAAKEQVRNFIDFEFCNERTELKSMEELTTNLNWAVRALTKTQDQNAGDVKRRIQTATKLLDQELRDLAGAGDLRKDLAELSKKKDLTSFGKALLDLTDRAESARADALLSCIMDEKG